MVDSGRRAVVPGEERLQASWRRSVEYGVSRERVDPVFFGRVDDSSLFVQCGTEALTQLHGTLADEPISLMLVDAEGLVLNRFSGDRSLLRALDDVHLAPGFSYSEREAGTNGLALALADRVPSVVRNDQHFAAVLQAYTCAAVPVLDPVDGHLLGAVNLTTHAPVPPSLLLALAQSAASTTTAYILARASGRQARPAPRGEVFRVEHEPGSGTLLDLSASWRHALEEAEQALRAGRVVVATGEPGSGRATLLAQAQRRARPHDRILSARAPAPEDVADWLALWTPEVGRPYTSVVVRDVDTLPAWGAQRLRSVLLDAAPGPSGGASLAMTAQRLEDVPAALIGAVETVVHVPPLRERPEDVLPLAHHAALRVRGRVLDITPAAARALTSAHWPGGVTQLVATIRAAATRTERIDVRHLPAEVLSDGQRRLSRMESVERDEIARALARPGTSVAAAAQELGLSRATMYRRIAQYGLQHRLG